MKKNLLYLIVLFALFTNSAKAQIVDTVATIPNGPITGKYILYARVRINDNTTIPGKINAVVALAQDPQTIGTTIAAPGFGLLSALIRFNNVSNTNNNNIIDAYNGTLATPGYQASADTAHFVLGNIYNLWFDIDFANKAYTPYAQQDGTTKIFKILDNVGFRISGVPNPTGLGYVLCVHNTDANSPSKISILSLSKVDNVSAISSVAASDRPGFYPNPAIKEIKLTSVQNVKSVEIVDYIGRQSLIVNHLKSNSINIGNLANGSYFVIITLNDGSKYSQMLIKR
jgi:hypothetical protein